MTTIPARPAESPPPYWGVRFCAPGGISYEGYQWRPIGEWSEAPDWDPTPVCGGGLHSQGPGGWGWCQPGAVLQLIEYAEEPVVVDGNKLKSRRARWLASDAEAWALIMAWTGAKFPGSLDLQGYPHPLPALQQIGGWADLVGYQHPLPALQQIGGWADLQGYPHPLPALQRIGGWADLVGYQHPLPALQQIGGSAYLGGYPHPLPRGTRVR